MPLINCEVNLELTWFRDCVITNSNGAGKFAITETKLYVPVVTLSTQDNAKLLQQLKSGFKRTINWNKYELSIKTFAQNRYLSYLINPTFQGVIRLFVLTFENENDRTLHSTYYFPKVEMKYYNVMIDGRNFFDQPINSMTKTYKIVLRLSSNMIGNNETNFPHKLLLTDRQVASLHKSFASHSSADIKLSKTQLSKMIQSEGFLSSLFVHY